MTATAVTGALLRRGLTVLWASPVAPVTAAAVHAVAGWLVVEQLALRGQAVLAPVVPVLGLLLVVASAVISVGLAADAESGELDLLLSVPTSGRAIAVGAWLASWLTLVVMVLPVGVMVALVAAWGDPDGGATAAMLLGLLTLTAACAAVGVLVATLARSTVLALAGSLLLMLGSWFLPGDGGRLPAPGGWSLSSRVRAAASGALDVGDVAFLLGLVLGCLVVASAVLDGRGPAGRAGGRRRRTGTVVVVLATLAVVAAADAQRWVLDLTEQRTLTLQQGTLDVLAALTDPTVITAFVPLDTPGRDLAVGLLDRYQDAAPAVEGRVLDPFDAPGEVRRLEADVRGPVVVQQGDRVEHAPSAVEADVTAALARLVRDEVPQVCVTTGHGEVALDATLPDGLAAFGEALAATGHLLATVDLLAAPSVDAACDVVVLAGPATQPGPAALDALAAHLAGGGSLLVLADPTADLDLTAVLAPYGVALDRGIVVEADPAAHPPDDPTSPIIARYSSSHPVVRNLAPIFLPGTQGLRVEDDTVDGRVVSRLADTSPASHLEREPLAAPGPDPGVDVLGPVTVAAAAQRTDADGVRSRVVVVGDADLATNAFITAGANATFLLQAMTWLTDGEDLVVSPNLPLDRRLELTPARLTYARVVTAGVVPALFLLAAATTWAARRRR